MLYWMQGIAMRVKGNFAFNFAAQQADRLGLPLLVYQGLRHDYPWASDRIHTFVLESVADLQREFGRRGIQYAFYLEGGRPDARTPGASSPLVQLAERAAVVVTEYSPTFIHPRQTRRLREKVETPVVAVDTAGVVPVAAIPTPHLTARGFRTEIQRHFPDHFRPVGTAEPRIRRTIDLPFEPCVVRDIPALVAGCDIDHAVAPSPTIRGGTTAARARLQHFLRTGLPRYAEERGDPNVDATSRLSAHLHFGTIGIQEVLFAAREAGPAAQYAKFEDEAVTWRELAWNYCHHEPKHRTIAGIPPWARAELERHEGDPRTLYALGSLEEGRTEDELWNAAQRHLVRDGELHNYVRMLWGKCVLPWTRNAAEALKVLEHLNHKYALDGRDPGSYGGIFWTFGKFDRPFYRRPVFGTVRYMSTRAAKEKFDVSAYIARSSQESL